MAHQGEYCNWPFLNQEEFELACAFFDQRYVRAKLGPTRNIFKVKTRRTLTTGSTYLEILRLLQLPEDEDDLALAFSRTRIGGIDPSDFSGDIDMANEDRDQVSGASGLSSPVCLPANQTKEILRSRPEAQAGDGEALPQYSIYSHQPYVIYEVHLHPTYNVPTLWFVLHDLPMGEQTFDIESIYRYLVPPQFKSQMRQFGPVGGISAAPHPLTDVPAFFIHPCQTKEAMENFDTPLTHYIMVWLGLVGGCVGLFAPPELVHEYQ